MAYLAGALRALRDVAGIDPAGADLIIGTSAGAIEGSMVALGIPVDGLAEHSFGTTPLSGLAIQPAWTGPIELARRTVGAGYVLARSLARFPLPRLPAPLGRLYPGGLAMPRQHDLLDAAFAGKEWPDQRLWLTAVDLQSGRRVVLRRRIRGEALAFDRALQSAIAVPVVFRPVRDRGRLLVDGGLHSTTNFDLARWAPNRHVIALAPLAFDPADRPALHHQVARRLFNAQVGEEMRALRRAGHRVLLISPGHEILRLHGVNWLRYTNTTGVVDASYQSTRRLLERKHDHDVLRAARHSLAMAS